MLRARRGRGRSRHRCHGVFLISVGTNATARATPAPACAGDAPHNIRSAMGMSSSANWLRSSMGISRLMPFLERMPGSFRSFSNSSLLCQNIPTCEAVDLPCPIAGNSGNFSPRVLRRGEGGFQYQGRGGDGPGGREAWRGCSYLFSSAKSGSFHQPPTMELELYMVLLSRGGRPPWYGLAASHPVMGSGMGSRRFAAQSYIFALPGPFGTNMPCAILYSSLNSLWMSLV